MSTGYAAKGSTLSYLTGTHYVSIDNLGDFGVSLGDADQIDITNHGSTGGFREFVAGLKNSEEVTIPITAWNPAAASHAWLITNNGGTAQTFKVILADTGACEIAFSALVNGLKIEAPVAGAITGSFKLKPTGAVTVTP